MGHCRDIARGEERFLVEWSQADNRVWYDILAFSKPNSVVTRLGYAIVRRLQRRFGRESAAAMQRAMLDLDTTAPSSTDIP